MAVSISRSPNDAHEVVVADVVEDLVVRFRVNVRRLESVNYVGYDLQQRIIEISWLEVLPGRRSLRTLFRALCAAMTVAVDLADGERCLLAVAPLQERHRERLARRPEFTEVSSAPFPLIAEMSDAAALAARFCHRFA